MRRIKAWVGVGANLGEPITQVLDAIDFLDRNDQMVVEARSSLYQTAPIGVREQADFINAVVRVRTSLDPLSVLGCLLQIEGKLGRLRDGSRNSPRRLDLDLLLYEKEIVNSQQLTLPHPRMHQRLFVLQPLMEIEGSFEIPGLGPIVTCITACQGQRVKKLVDSKGQYCLHGLEEGYSRDL